eukprot:11278222-Prorocentrum_lima.AAC.1
MKPAAMIKRVGWAEWQKLPMEAKQPWIDLCCSEAALRREGVVTPKKRSTRTPFESVVKLQREQAAVGSEA